jgi:hypothetical protein
LAIRGVQRFGAARLHAACDLNHPKNRVVEADEAGHEMYGKRDQGRVGLENRPARLDLTFYPYLPAATVGTTDPRAYLGLIAGQDSVSLAAGAQA